MTGIDGMVVDTIDTGKSTRLCVLRDALSLFPLSKDRVKLVFGNPVVFILPT